MLKHAALTIVATGFLLALGGCPRSSGSSGSDPNGPLTHFEFTAQRQAAVTAVVEQVVAATGAFSTLAALADPRLDLDGGGFGTFGTCPAVNFVSSGSSAIVQLDFRQGCTAAATGAATIAGGVDVNVFLADGGARVQFSNLSIDGHDVLGFIDAARFEASTGGRELEGTVDLDTDGADSFESQNVSIVLGADGQTVLSGTDVRLRSSTGIYFVDMFGVTADPALYDNFVPADGRLSFLGPGAIELTIMFSRRSAEEGVVRVVVGDGSAINFQVLGGG